MKIMGIIGLAAATTFTLVQSADAYPRGTSRSFSSTPHFSAPRFSAPAGHYSAPSRSFSNNAARFNAPARFSSAPRFQNRPHAFAGPRVPATTALRNTGYLNRARFSGDRTAAFNSRTVSPSTARLVPGNRTLAARSQGFDRGRVIARHGANWHRHWDRRRDHWWRGHRCHFRNGFWFVYDPFPFYPYYGLYPYGAYYGAGYYDTYAADYEPAVDTNQSEYQGDSQVSDVQSALARDGYYDGPIDGDLGPATRKALRRFQRDRGLEVTGGINRAVIDALRLR